MEGILIQQVFESGRRAGPLDPYPLKLSGGPRAAGTVNRAASSPCVSCQLWRGRGLLGACAGTFWEALITSEHLDSPWGTWALTLRSSP